MTFMWPTVPKLKSDLHEELLESIRTKWIRRLLSLVREKCNGARIELTTPRNVSRPLWGDDLRRNAAVVALVDLQDRYKLAIWHGQSYGYDGGSYDGEVYIVTLIPPESLSRQSPLPTWVHNFCAIHFFTEFYNPPGTPEWANYLRFTHEQLLKCVEFIAQLVDDTDIVKQESKEQTNRIQHLRQLILAQNPKIQLDTVYDDSCKMHMILPDGYKMKISSHINRFRKLMRNLADDYHHYELCIVGYPEWLQRYHEKLTERHARNCEILEYYNDIACVQWICDMH
jgi:hypothetical protein